MNPLIIGGAFATVYAMLSPITSISHDSPQTDNNLDAFLQIIRDGESSDNYRAIVGGGSFNDYSKHPGLNSDGSVNRSFLPGAASHAAGAYQFQPGTWQLCARALGLTDFGPDSQDAAAIYNLQRIGAYDAVLNGDIDAAIDRCKNEWQMFQTSKWNTAYVKSQFQSYGGNLA